MEDNKQTFIQSLKQVAGPLAAILGPLFIIFYFAGEQWIRVIARDEIALGAGSSAASQVQEHATRITKVEGKADVNTDDIDDNEEDIDTVEKRFHELVQTIMDKI